MHAISTTANWVLKFQAFGEKKTFLCGIFICKLGISSNYFDTIRSNSTWIEEFPKIFLNKFKSHLNSPVGIFKNFVLVADCFGNCELARNEKKARKF